MIKIRSDETSLDLIYCSKFFYKFIRIFFKQNFSIYKGV